MNLKILLEIILVVVFCSLLKEQTVAFGPKSCSIRCITVDLLQLQLGSCISVKFSSQLVKFRGLSLLLYEALELLGNHRCEKIKVLQKYFEHTLF